jgi:hypothetical protein
MSERLNDQGKRAVNATHQLFPLPDPGLLPASGEKESLNQLPIRPLAHLGEFLRVPNGQDCGQVSRYI